MLIVHFEMKSHKDPHTFVLTPNGSSAAGKIMMEDFFPDNSSRSSRGVDRDGFLVVEGRPPLPRSRTPSPAPQSRKSKAITATLEYEGYSTHHKTRETRSPGRGISDSEDEGRLPSLARATPAKSATEFEGRGQRSTTSNHETNRKLVLDRIAKEQHLLQKESTASKALFKANLFQTKKELKKNKATVEQLEQEYQRAQEARQEMDTKLHSLEEYHELKEAILQCQILNLKLLKDYFLKDKEWKSSVRLTSASLENLYSLDRLFANNKQQQSSQSNTQDQQQSLITKRDIDNIKKRLEKIKYLYVGYQTSHRKGAKDPKALQQGLKMKMEAIDKFNQLNVISIMKQ